MKRLVALASAVVGGLSLAAESPWRVTPIWGGGSVQNVVICPSNPDVWYAYVDVCGPFRSDDAGASWRDLHRNMTPSMCWRSFNHPRGLSVDPRDPDRFVIAAGDNDWRPGGIAVSRDGGKTFIPKVEARFYGNGKRRRLGQVLDRDPFDPDRLIAGEDWDGVFVSADNGESWRPSGLDRTYLNDLRFDRTVRDRIYAASAAHVVNELLSDGPDRPPHAVPEPVREAGFFRSDDGGATWRKLADDAPVEIVQIPGDTALLGIFGERFVRRSDDGGATWREFGEGLPTLGHAPDKALQRGRFNSFACGARGRFWVVGDTDGNFFRRSAGDAAWTEVKRESYSFSDPEREPWLCGPRKRHAEMPGSLVVDPRDEDHWLLTDWYNIMESHDGGRNWRSRNAGIQQLCPFTVSCDPHTPDNIVYGVADMGVFCSTNGGRTYFAPRCSGGVNSVAWSTATKGLVLVTGGKIGIQFRRSRDGGATWETPKLAGLPKLEPRKNAAYTVAENPATGVFYMTVSGEENAPGQAGVYRSSDAGDSWQWCGEGLPRNLKGGFKNQEFANQEPQLVFSPDGSAVLFLLSGDVYCRKGAGGPWERSNLRLDCRNWDTCRHPGQLVVADPHTPGRFLSPYGAGYMHIAESTDGGKTFRRTWMQTGAVYSLSFDRQVKGAIYASKFDGIYFSRDDGRHWSYLEDSLNLPCGASRRIYADRNRLFFLTDGTGVWVRDLQ